MNRQQAIERWKVIAQAVFWAEDAIYGAWAERLKTVNDLSREDRERIADEYCEAIATEIVNKVSDEQLAQME